MLWELFKQNTNTLCTSFQSVPCPWTLRQKQTGSQVSHQGLCIFWTSQQLPPGIQVSAVLHHQYLQHISNERNEIQNNGWWLVLYFPTVPAAFITYFLILLKLAASGSSVLITMTFQSVSPSSIKARVPSTFTLIISPREHTWESKLDFRNRCKQSKRSSVAPPQTCSSTLFPMSHISIGSLSPQHPVSLSLWLGSSHVCDKERHMLT